MKIPNQIFKFGLSPSELRTYCALLAIAGKRNLSIKHSTLTERFGIPQRTIERGIQVLCEKGLITKTCEYYWDKGSASSKRTANRYFVKPISGGYFHLDYRMIAKVGASASAFCCYAFLCKCMNKGRMAFPSLTKISKFTGMARATVVKAIVQLESLALLWKRNYIRVSGCFGNNNYILVNTWDEEEQKQEAEVQNKKMAMVRIEIPTDYDFSSILNVKIFNFELFRPPIPP